LRHIYEHDDSIKYVSCKTVKVNQVGLKLNGRYQLPVYADDVNLLGDNIDTLKENMETLIDTSKEVGLEVNTEKKTKYMLLSRHHNAGKSWHKDS
jgi:hypothetical protein